MTTEFIPTPLLSALCRDLKNHMPGTMFCRGISGNLCSCINDGEAVSGETDFDYAAMLDEDAGEQNLNETLEQVLRDEIAKIIAEISDCLHPRPLRHTVNGLTSGLPAEIEARQKQYENCREKRHIFKPPARRYCKQIRRSCILTGEEFQR